MSRRATQQAANEVKIAKSDAKFWRGKAASAKEGSVSRATYDRAARRAESRAADAQRMADRKD